MRPSWEAVRASLRGYTLCSCGATLQSVGTAREHWQQGHFDTADESLGAWMARVDARLDEIINRLQRLEEAGAARPAAVPPATGPVAAPPDPGLSPDFIDALVVEVEALSHNVFDVIAAHATPLNFNEIRSRLRTSSVSSEKPGYDLLGDTIAVLVSRDRIAGPDYNGCFRIVSPRPDRPERPR